MPKGKQERMQRKDKKPSIRIDEDDLLDHLKTDLRKAGEVGDRVRKMGRVKPEHLARKMTK